MAKTVLQLQDLVGKLENELELSKFLNKGVLQTNLEYKARIADLEYENGVLRTAESRLAATEDALEDATAKAEKLEERLVEEEARTQAALQREAAAVQKATAAAAQQQQQQRDAPMTFQDKLRKAEWEAEWEEAVRGLEQEKDAWQQKYEQLSRLLAPVISALSEGRTIDMHSRRPKATPNGRNGHNGHNGRVNGVNGHVAHLANGRAHVANGHSAQHAARSASRPSTATSASTSRPPIQVRHSSPIRQKRKSGSDEDDVFRPKSTPDRITKASKVGGQQSVRRMRRPNYGVADDWSDVDGDVDVKSEPDSDCDPLAL